MADGTYTTIALPTLITTTALLSNGYLDPQVVWSMGGSEAAIISTILPVNVLGYNVSAECAVVPDFTDVSITCSGTVYSTTFSFTYTPDCKGCPGDEPDVSYLSTVVTVNPAITTEATTEASTTSTSSSPADPPSSLSTIPISTTTSSTPTSSILSTSASADAAIAYTDSLSPGALAGIVIGAVACLFATALFLFCFIRRRRKSLRECSTLSDETGNNHVLQQKPELEVSSYDTMEKHTIDEGDIIPQCTVCRSATVSRRNDTILPNAVFAVEEMPGNDQNNNSKPHSLAELPAANSRAGSWQHLQNTKVWVETE